MARPTDQLLSGYHRIQIAARARRSVASVTRVYRGQRVTAAVYEDVVETADELGLPPPPQQPTEAALPLS